MAPRIDSVQLAVPRAVMDAAQQHAAQRQPVVAQEQQSKAVRDDARAREQRPEAMERRDTSRQAKNELVAAVEGRTPDEGARRRPRRTPRRTADDTGEADTGMGAGPGTGASIPRPKAGDVVKGQRVDLRA